MKKIVTILSVISVLILVVSGNSLTVNASNKNFHEVSRVVEQTEDGYTIETVIIEELTTTRASTKTGTKKVSYYNGNRLLWSVSVTGTFTYDNSTAKATKSVVTTAVNDSNWKITSKSSSYSGNTAIAKAVGTRYASGISVQTVSREVKLSCSSSGGLS